MIRLPLRIISRLLRFTARWSVRLAILAVIFVAFMIPEGDVRTFTPSELAASGYIFSIPGWEIGNFLDKWTHRATSIFTGRIGEEEGQALLTEYTAMSDQIREVQGRRDRTAADPDATAEELRSVESELKKLKDRRRSMRNDTEEYLESAISTTVRSFGFGGPLGFLWPPVDFRLEEPPHVLITSPRDRIERLDSLLLSPDINAVDSESVESRLREDNNLSGIVLPLGGVATYPTFVNDDDPLIRTLNLAAHEWLHAYFFFNPLGRHLNSSVEMNILNETIANIAGEELGNITYTRLTGKEVEVEEDAAADVDPDEFSFNDFMRETRKMTDQLLADGDVDGAEAYMESRRVELQDHHFFIRKLNQAWFAFNGTYGDSPASISPIGDQVKELRSLLPDIGELLRRTRGSSSYDEFLDTLRKARAAAGPAEGLDGAIPASG